MTTSDTPPEKAATQREGPARNLARIFEKYSFPFVMLACLGCSWLTSFTGVVAMAEWIAGASEATRHVAALITAAAMGAQFTIWHFAMRLIPLYETGSAKATGFLVLLVSLVLLGLTSTFTSFIGLAGDSARGFEAQVQADDAAQRARLVSKRAAATSDAVFAIRPQAAIACQRYKDELASGVLTGAAGPGVVTSTLLGFCTGKRDILSALEETVAENAAHVQALGDLSREMDAVIFDLDRSIFERELAILDLARRMENRLYALEDADRTKGLRVVTQGMANSVRELSEASGGLAQRQAAAIRSIIAEEQAFGAAIEGLFDAIDALPLPEPSRAQLRPAQVLVLSHWSMHLPQLALALVVDLFAPLSAALFFAAALRRKDRNTNRKGD